MKAELDGYIQPPSYEDIEDTLTSENPLINKLHKRIYMDLQQINGVYNDQIKDIEKAKLKAIRDLDIEFKNRTDNINKQRKKDIDKYNVHAEARIDELISSINNPSRCKRTFLEWIGLY